MTERGDQVIVLLRSRTNWHGPIRVATFGGESGEKATEWVLCRPCGGTGNVRERAKKGAAPVDVPCEKCEGAGRYLVDAYTGRKEGEVNTGNLFNGSERAAHEAAVVAQIDRLKKQTAPPKSSDADIIAETTPFQWERERERYFKAGSYHELDEALEWLNGKSPQARALIEWVYVSGALELGCLADSILTSAELAVELLADRMPDPIRVPHWLIESQTGGARRKQERHAA